MYWLMSIKKMKVLNEVLKLLLEVLPISKTIGVILRMNKNSNLT